MDNALWIPLVVLFGAALITALLKRYSRDPCLKQFHGSFVFVRIKSGKWIWGKLRVYSNALELLYTSPARLGTRHSKTSYIFYEQNLDNIDRVLRPSPAEGTPEFERWQREIAGLQHPSPVRRLKRRFRNTVNLLRDAFAQAIVMIFGAVKKTRALARVPIADDRVSEVGKSLINVVPNAYEPILEKYLGRRVVVETVQADKIVEQVGTLQEYSAKYVLTRSVELLPDTPPRVAEASVDDDKFDVIFPRLINSVRHSADGA